MTVVLLSPEFKPRGVLSDLKQIVDGFEGNKTGDWENTLEANRRFGD